ncbi:uncharacterized protein LOC143185115 [Calliopsis andreniformis]|uniref:uncharacterized protein LOC143185115 n=1 Tax=Calliopsis andreniformis TaxID=337506 RepID=UPI003FCD570C
MSGQRDSTCQKNDLPKSLQGTEDAEFVWNMIVERFPNAAPLLCEMETVIERAEDLLEQLRVPCCREIETSTSFCTPESETISMMSARGSLTAENENVENYVSQSVAEVQVSESKICVAGDIDFIDHKQKRVSHEQNCGDRLSSFLPTREKSSTVEKPSSMNVDTYVDQRTKEARSLEAWEKVVGNALRKSTLADDQAPKASIDKKHTRNKENKKDTSMKERENSCIILHCQRMGADVGDSTVEINSEQNIDSQELIESKDDTVSFKKLILKGNGDISLQKGTGRTALSILQAYAERCKVPVVYQHITDGPHRHKSNVHVIRGNLGGFAATCRGNSEESTKNCVAMKILRMIANQQMDDEKLVTLMDLTKEEYVLPLVSKLTRIRLNRMLEIINFNMDSPRETAQRKLYQLCLEKGEPVPKYTHEKIESYKGLTYVATCTALGYSSEGRGHRECMAKKAAAEELYRQYYQAKKLGYKKQ